MANNKLIWKEKKHKTKTDSGVYEWITWHSGPYEIREYGPGFVIYYKKDKKGYTIGNAITIIRAKEIAEEHSERLQKEEAAV